MCNAQVMKPSQAFPSGPATQALEQAASKKRRLENSKGEEPVSFDFDALFEAVSPDGEAFPSIAWSFDDEPAISVESIKNSICSPENNSGERFGLGMRRSKSLKRDLASLDVECLNLRVSVASIDKISCSQFFITEPKSDCLPMFSCKQSSFASSVRPSNPRRQNDLDALRSSRTLSAPLA